jgi:hypothetical protein
METLENAIIKLVESKKIEGKKDLINKLNEMKKSNEKN